MSERLNVLAVCSQPKPGGEVVWHVLTTKLPEMTNDELANLSWKLDQFFGMGLHRQPKSEIASITKP